jgi:hypothetical protein
MDRDDLVFRQGTLHLFSFVQDFQIVSFNPNSSWGWPAWRGSSGHLSSSAS